MKIKNNPHTAPESPKGGTPTTLLHKFNFSPERWLPLRDREQSEGILS
jgi:hypothetical protein